MDIGKKIKQLRISNGLTQEELASKLGLQKSAIAKYENGRVTNIKRINIEKMASIFHCSPLYLLSFDEDFVIGNELNKILVNVSKMLNKPYNEVLDIFQYYDFGKKYKTSIDITENNILKYFRDFYSTHFYEDSKSQSLINTFKDLTPEGQEKVIDYAKDLHNNPLYTDDAIILNAARLRTDREVTEEEKKYDDDIMKNDNF